MENQMATMPQAQKAIKAEISNVQAKIYKFESYEKELSDIGSRLAKIGMAINFDDHPNNFPQVANASEPVNQEPYGIEKPYNREDLVGEITRMGKLADELDLALRGQLGAVLKNLSYIENYI